MAAAEAGVNIAEPPPQANGQQQEAPQLQPAPQQGQWLYNETLMETLSRSARQCIAAVAAFLVSFFCYLKVLKVLKWPWHGYLVVVLVARLLDGKVVCGITELLAGRWGGSFVSVHRILVALRTLETVLDVSSIGLVWCWYLGASAWVQVHTLSMAIVPCTMARLVNAIVAYVMDRHYSWMWVPDTVQALHVWPFTQLLLIILKVDGYLSQTWLPAFTPLLVLLGAMFITGMLFAYAELTNQPDTPLAERRLNAALVVLITVPTILMLAYWVMDFSWWLDSPDSVSPLTPHWLIIPLVLITCLLAGIASAVFVESVRQFMQASPYYKPPVRPPPGYRRPRYLQRVRRAVYRRYTGPLKEIVPSDAPAKKTQEGGGGVFSFLGIGGALTSLRATTTTSTTTGAVEGEATGSKHAAAAAGGEGGVAMPSDVSRLSATEKTPLLAESTAHAEAGHVTPGSQTGECPICNDRVCDTVIMECGHGDICYICAKKVHADRRKCPFCDQPMAWYHKVESTPYIVTRQVYRAIK
ncbi:unnamed protein product [Vitrella brassicaformis CCMP3155]|uniref:RING-type domain-containing protein n=2 Tax=Vitrella brassicaformis TaxID=1169539 RepID=A0A0G4F136_VITBC|nr:unnamed protein product [Vitrella brassicaformis CCMP3155]|eukprot:CEM05407.1 unnamed protein product [Vitrella brassicaformis CCMP3155]